MSDIDYGVTVDVYKAGLLAERAEAETTGDTERVAAVEAELATLAAPVDVPALETAVAPVDGLETR